MFMHSLAWKRREGYRFWWLRRDMIKTGGPEVRGLPVAEIPEVTSNAVIRRFRHY